MELKNIISLGVFFIFLLVISFTNNRKKTYILSVLCLFPFIDLVVTPERVGGFSIFELMSFFSFALVFNDLKFPLHKIPLYFGLFLSLSFIILLGSLQSLFVRESLLNFLKYFSGFIYAKIFIDVCIREKAFRENVLNILRFVCILSIVFLTFQMLSGLSFSFYTDLNPNTQVETGIRYPSFFSDSQKYAQFLSMCSFLFLMKSEKNRLYNKYHYFLFALVIFSLLITGGRAGLLGTSIGLAAIVFLGERKYKIFGVICGCIALLGFLYFSNYLIVFNREQTIDDSFNVRLEFWKAAVSIFQKYPLLGIGEGNYQNYVEVYKQDQYWMLNGEILYMNHPESGYLKYLVEFGIFGFLISLLFLFLPLISALKLYLHKQKDFTMLFICAGVISFLVSFITLYSLSDKRILVTLITLISLLIVHYQSYKQGNYEY